LMRDELQQLIHAWSTDRLVLASLDDAPLPVGLRDLPVTPLKPEFDSGTKQLIERVRAVADQGIALSAPGDKSARPGRWRIPIGVAMGVIFLGEALTASAWTGLVCVLIGVAAMTVPARKAAAA